MPLKLSITETEGKPGQVYYPLHLTDVPIPVPGPQQLLIKMSAAALNHRDLFIRQRLYPAISFTPPMLADGSGTVTDLGPNCSPASASLRGKLVILTPHRGWEADPLGPENDRAFSIIGSNAFHDFGTAQEWLVVHEDEVVAAPEHLSPVEAAALPLVGLTGWRALVTKALRGEVTPASAGGQGQSVQRNVLVTGIGGGVALQVLQFAVALGCRVWVTSGDAAKIERAKAMGAMGGVSYKDADWAKQLGKLLPADRPFLDAVVDGAGGDVVASTVRLLRSGGVISCYGMTVGPSMDWTVQAMLRNVELRGSTMGSKREFKEMVEFVREKKIRPVVSRVVKGLGDLQAVDGLFEDMKAGKQFGKLVIQIDVGEGGSPKL